MELRLSNDFNSAKRLDEIMNSYPGRDQGSIMADRPSLTVVLFLLEHGEIKITEHAYLYNHDIRDDSEIMEVYTELARETRWKRFEHTEIEGIRINALYQMRHEGKPSYDGKFICYRDGSVCIHCGNLSLIQMLMHLADHEQTERFYIFSYPYWAEDQTAKFYRFDLTKTAIAGAGIYRESVWAEMQKASEVSGVIPAIPWPEDDLPSPS